MKPIDVEAVKSRLAYDPESGLLTWKSHFHLSKIGAVAGTTDRKGYIAIKFDGRRYYAARLAWILFHGKDIEPSNVLDHIDRSRDNNRIVNLREVTHSENALNRGTWLGESEPRNYTRHKTGKYQAQVNGKYLGLFETKDQAASAALKYAEGAMP